MSAIKHVYNTFTKAELHDLLIEAKDGSKSAFNELMLIIRSISYSYFKSKHNYGKLASIEDAEDLVNDVFITFAKQYQDIDNIEHWLRRVMFLSFVNFYKKEKSRTFLPFDESFFNYDQNENPGKHIDEQAVAAILPKLKHPKDKIIRMRFWEGLKFCEIAERLNKNESAVKKMFYRTLVEMKKMLE